MRHLSGKEKKEIKEQLPQGYKFDKKDEIIVDNNDVVLKDKKPYLIYIGENYFPHLKSLPEGIYPSVYVDKGAIPFLLKGADMMRPGIQKIEGDFKENDIIVIRDENHSKALGLGFSMISSDEMRKTNSGKVVKVFHYVNDSFY